MIGVIGLDAQGAPVAVRGRLAFAGARRLDALRQLCALPTLDEALILSTCQRTEVYVATAAWPAAREAVTRFLAAVYQTGPEMPGAVPLAADTDASDDDPFRATPAFYTLDGLSAAGHALQVAAGLRSLVAGEAQVLGQVKEAVAAAAAAGSMGDELRALFVHAVRAGKRVRAETALGRVDDSLAAAAVRQLDVTLGGLAGTTALVIGAGRTGRLCARLLRTAGVGRLLVANRSVEAARDMAADLGGEAISLGDVAATIGGVDAVVSATAAPWAILDAATVARARHGGRGPLAIVDLASPADIEPAVGRLPGVTLYALDALGETGDPARAAAMEAAEALVDDERRAWACARRMRQLGPSIAALRHHVVHAAQAEVARRPAPVGHLLMEDRRAAERQLADRIFHPLIAHVRSLAADETISPAARAAIMARLVADAREGNSTRYTIAGGLQQ